MIYVLVYFKFCYLFFGLKISEIIYLKNIVVEILLVVFEMLLVKVLISLILFIFLIVFFVKEYLKLGKGIVVFVLVNLISFWYILRF